MTLNASKKSQEALEQEIVSYSNSIGAAYICRAFCYEEYGKTEMAEKDFETAKNLCQKDHYYYQIAWRYQRKKNAEKAIENYNIAIESNPTYGPYYKNRALMHKELKQYKEAISDYEKVLELETERSWVRDDCDLDIIDCYIELGDYEKALELCTEYETKRKRYLNTRFEIPDYRIRIYEQMGEYEKALKVAKELFTDYESVAYGGDIEEDEDGDFDGLFTRKDMEHNEEKIAELEAIINQK